ncbi:MAG TPA: methylenetetrahydrofolate reductase C-terminal domain-containing protein [bacterium]|nr:methylenetetrahydrofolate reductase C-terminal domain-containing protein [bacterium]HQO33503.1 methylenetetrahydrofolate reductase C-terminal domain-containing protein [bacterium]HQP97188.1 methylenetetrahydrofolate reductase C-terminal domain-containing protein [bacterium]
MIVADRKKVPEIRDMIKEHSRVLLVGCGTCVTVCLAGGERETGILGSALRMALRLIGRDKVVVDECTIERQCEDAFIDILAPRVKEYDAICSLGCGAGVQALAERFPNTAVYPGLNTQFIGILEAQGVWTEKCAGCGSCRLGEFVGICPITRCAKRLLNGPCAGSRNGKCEIVSERECAWQLIYDRARTLGVLERFARIAEPHDWSTGPDGGPRKVIREDQCIAGLGPKA